MLSLDPVSQLIIPLTINLLVKVNVLLNFLNFKYGFLLTRKDVITRVGFFKGLKNTDIFLRLIDISFLRFWKLLPRITTDLNLCKETSLKNEFKF